MLLGAAANRAPARRAAPAGGDDRERASEAGANVTRFNQALQSLGIGSRFDNGFAADLGVVFP